MKQLEETFLLQFDRHIVRPGISLVIKHLGKKWSVHVKEGCSTSATGMVDELSSAMGALSTEDTVCTYFLILSSTRIVFTMAEQELPSSSPVSVSVLSDFGGARDVVDAIKRMCSVVFQRPTGASGMLLLQFPMIRDDSSIVVSLDAANSSPRGLLLYGPSGTGKSLLIRAMANHFSAGLVTIQGPELFSKYYGETETRLREKFTEALQL